jgi:hypothetical protein
VLECLKNPVGSAIGAHFLYEESDLTKAPTLVRATPMWHVYYLDVHGRVQFRAFNAGVIGDEAAVKLHVLNYHGSHVLEITKIEREFEVPSCQPT